MVSIISFVGVTLILQLYALLTIILIPVAVLAFVVAFMYLLATIITCHLKVQTLDICFSRRREVFNCPYIVHTNCTVLDQQTHHRMPSV
jgi:hypothetical protein